MNENLYILQNQLNLFMESAEKNLNKMREINEKFFSNLLIIPEFLAIAILKTKKYKRLDKEYDLIYARYINEWKVIQILKEMINKEIK